MKRIVLLVIVVGVIPGYYLYDCIDSARKLQQAEEYAIVTARVWVATAIYRDDEERFLSYRDSLLKATGLSREKMVAYLEMYEDRPERHEAFVKLVKKYVDSLTALEPGSFLPPVSQTLDTL